MLAIISMSIFSSPVSTGWSSQHVHCQLSVSLFRVNSVYPCDVAKMGIPNVVNGISGYKALENKPLSVNICSNLVATQSCPWNSRIVSVTAGAGAGRGPMVPSFRSLIDGVRDCSQQHQSCMQFVQWRAQWNSVLQCHVRKLSAALRTTDRRTAPPERA